MHVGEPFGAPGVNRNGPLDDAGNGKTSMSRWIAVAVAARSGSAGFGEAPRCGEARLGGARQRALTAAPFF